MAQGKLMERLCKLLDEGGVRYTLSNDGTIRYVTRYGVVIAYEHDGSMYALHADVNGAELTPEQVYHMTVRPDRDAVGKRFRRLLTELDEHAGLALRSYVTDDTEDLLKGLNGARRALRELDAHTEDES